MKGMTRWPKVTFMMVCILMASVLRPSEAKDAFSFKYFPEDPYLEADTNFTLKLDNVPANFIEEGT